MEQALYQAAILTFEELGFMFPMENGDKTEIAEAASVSVGVGFQGSFSGTIVLQVENDVLPVIAANMLGENEPLERELMVDALGELANVICGNALPVIAGKREVFRLQPPQIVSPKNLNKKLEAAAHLEVDEGYANVMLYVN